MQKIGRYEILEELGRGSMGAVFKARDPQIARIVAIKIILTANLPKEENDLYRSRFYREAQAAGQMSHPGIVVIHDIAEDDNGQPYLVMEYVEGHTLHKLLRPDPHGKITERFPLARTLDLCAQVAEAMAYAHERNVVHRDIKPSNIMVTPQGRAKIADFGIARLSGTEATHTASITGTPAYMSPEQFRGGTIDSRSDIFSLGSMLYWMATGEKAFPGDNVTQVSFNVVYREPAPPKHIAPDVPDPVATVLSRCLAKRPENRYPTAGEVAADLRAILEGKDIVATVAPAEMTVEDTVATIQNVTPIGKPLAEASAALRPGTKAAPQRNLTSILTLLAVAALAAGAWFWQQSHTPEQSFSNSPAAARQAPVAAAQAAPAGNSAAPAGTVAPPPPPVADSAAAPGPSGSGAPAGEKTAAAHTKSSAPNAAPEKGVPKKSPLGTGATLAVDCRHNFKAADLEIVADSESLWQTKLEGKPGAFGKSGGNVNQNLSLRPGKHKVVVKVTSTADKYIEEREIEGDFTQGQTRTLEIRFGRGTALGFGRNLSLKWKKD